MTAMTPQAAESLQKLQPLAVRITATLSGKEYDGDTARAMWGAVAGQSFDYLYGGFHAMRGGHYHAEAGLRSVSCTFTLDFADAAGLRAFIAHAPVSSEYDEAAGIECYRRLRAIVERPAGDEPRERDDGRR